MLSKSAAGWLALPDPKDTNAEPEAVRILARAALATRTESDRGMDHRLLG